MEGIFKVTMLSPSASKHMFACIVQERIFSDVLLCGCFFTLFDLVYVMPQNCLADLLKLACFQFPRLKVFFKLAINLKVISGAYIWHRILKS